MRPVPGKPLAAHAGGRGLSQEDVARVIASQGGVCAVCREVPRRWDIDHDHACKYCGGVTGCRRCFRAMLCSSCNTMLGMARDRPEVLRAGAEYLEVAAAALARRG